MSERALVIYHGGCRDGFCAAWVAHRALGDVDFHAGYYGQPPPDVDGRNVFIVDFSYPRALMDEINRRAASLVVLDHHKTAAADMEGAPYATFDMNRSGAGMAWDHFFPGQPRPWLVDYTEDRDLWRFKLPGSREYNGRIAILPFDFAAWTEAEGRQDGAHEMGEAVIAKTAQYVAEVRKNARRVMFAGRNVPIVNAPQVDISELLDALALGEPFAVGWWQRADGVFQYSLRSRGDFDVSELAREYGGGGHKNAAGFQSEELLYMTAAKLPITITVPPTKIPPATQGERKP